MNAINQKKKMIANQLRFSLNDGQDIREQGFSTSRNRRDLSLLDELDGENSEISYYQTEYQQ